MNPPIRRRRSRALRPAIEALEAITLLSAAASALPAALAPARRLRLAPARDDAGRAADHAATPSEQVRARREALGPRSLADRPRPASGRGPARVESTGPRRTPTPPRGSALAAAIRHRNHDSGGLVAAKAKAAPVDGVTTKGSGYQIITLGSPDDAQPTTASPGMALVGGGTDVDAVFPWMSAKATGGDFLVLRASGTGAYNSYIAGLVSTADGLTPFDSVTTIITSKPSAAYDPEVLRLVGEADAIFLAGGDQADYVTLWDDTPLERAILDRARSVPIGGTSAGLAVLGETDFAALNGTITSDQALSDPYGRRVSLSSELLAMPVLDNVITDSHFVTRDRLGRLVTFLARTVADGGNLIGEDAAPMLGLGINEQTALLVEPDGSSQVVSNLRDETTASVYLVRTAAGLSDGDIVRARTPLTYSDMLLYRAQAGVSFDLDDPSSWTMRSSMLWIEAGVLRSSKADPYA